MPRDLSPAIAEALEAGLIIPAIFATLTFRSSTQYVWSGLGNIVIAGQTFIGVGSLGQIGGVQEGIAVNADGTSITLSGIDPTLLNDSMTDILPGAPATLALGLFTTNGVLIDSLIPLYVGTMDQPKVSSGGDKISITIALENRMIDGSRPTMLRYTSASQKLMYPSDSGFDWVEPLNDQADRWGN